MRQKTSTLGRHVRPYALGVIALAGVTLAGAWLTALGRGAPIGFSELVFWIGMAFVAELFWLDNARGEGMVSMASAVNIATIALLPLELLTAVTALSVLASARGLRQRSMLRSSFNAGQSVLAVTAGWFALHALGGSSLSAATPAIASDPLPITIAIGCFWLVNTGLVSGVVALDHGRSIGEIWRGHYANLAYGQTFAALAAIGLLLVGATQSFGLIAAPLSIALFLVTREAHRGWTSRARSLRGGEGDLARDGGSDRERIAS